MPRRRPGTVMGRRLAAASAVVGLAVACHTAVTRPPSPPPPAVTAEEPPPPVTPLPPLPVPPRVRRVERWGAPLTVRVGLATDLTRVEIPCCGRVTTPGPWGEEAKLTAPLVVEPAARAADPGVFRLQAAALKDQGQAEELARRLGETTGWTADARFDAAAGLYRVRVGRWRERSEAEEARTGATEPVLAEAWVVTEGGGVRDPALGVSLGGAITRLVGRWLTVAGDDRGLEIEGTRYRGRLLVYLNDRGHLNLINELPLESYLRGVVPQELGPAAYPQLEALKAQAVAARTYTVRNLGEFADEGYDICSTPRCQVYGGMDVEHPLSDRAVVETAGEVLLWRGQPIDALYSSSCGGHTEDVGTVFPLKRSLVYLRGVPCLEGGSTPLATAITDGAPLDAVDGGAVDGERGVREEDATFQELTDGRLVVREGGFVRRIGLPSAVPAFRQLGEGARGADLALAPGDRLRLLWRDDRLVALVQRIPVPRPGPRARRGPWRRFRTDEEVAAAVELRYPGLDLAGFEVSRRGVSGRVGRLRLLGKEGRQEVVEGLAVRWTLDLPDTLFTVRRAKEGGRSGWLFTGRGWGHGVGMCQLGAYGMAGRGHDYRSILLYYYTGVELGRVVTHRTLVEQEGDRG